MHAVNNGCVRSRIFQELSALRNMATQGGGQGAYVLECVHVRESRGRCITIGGNPG